MSDPELVLLLRFDQRQRWEQGEHVLVEAYLEKQPALRDDPDALLDLIYHEVVLRADREEQLHLEEYVRRFPELEAQLRVQFEVHRAIEGDPPPTQIGLSPMGLIVAEDRTNLPKSGPKDTFSAEYEILDELGRGGMGVVYRARQTSLKRLVALKLILGGPHASARNRERFRTEAEAVARLQHPNIVQIYQVSEHDGCLFLSLELVDGPNLDQKFGGVPQPARFAAQLVETLARAMHYAHQRGIIHRDLKPANVLLTAEGEPKITDFGLARLLDAEGGRASSETLVGTPQYMAPEQAGGEVRGVGAGADVHALGAVLYQLLTGRPPFRGKNLPEILEQVRLHPPIAPRRWAKVPRDLETICLKCLEKNPGRRYASAGDLADDLRHYLDGEPVRARPVPAWRRVLKWARRRPTAAALVTVCAAALLSLAAFVLWHNEDVRNTAKEARDGGRLEVEQARRRYQQFLRGRDDALFYCTYGTVFTDSDQTANRKATREAVEAALALVGTDSASETAPVLDPHWSEAEKTEALAGCYQLLLILAEVTAGTSSGQTSDERSQARRALALLDRAAQLVPPTPAYHLRRARYLLRLGENEEARKERARAAELRPERMIDFFLLGEEHYRQERFENASEDFENALRREPNDFWSRYFLGLCHLQGRFPLTSKADAEFSECIRQRPKFVWAYLLRGYTREKRHAFEDAEADYQTVLDLKPNPDAVYCLHVNRGRMRGQRQQCEAAITDLKHAVALKPVQCEAYVELAKFYLKQKRFLDAVHELVLALRFDLSPRLRADCQEMLGYALYSAGRREEAVDALDQALVLRPGAAAVRALRARAFLDLGRYEEAIRGYDEAVREYGKNLSDNVVAAAEIYRGRGLARMKLRQYLSAMDDYTRALELHPEAADLHAHRGWAYFSADAWKPALRDFQEALARNPDNTDARIGRGLARVMLGQYHEAVADARAALQRKPDTPEMMHNIACTFALAAGKVETDSTETNRLALAAGYRREAIDAVRPNINAVALRNKGFVLV